MSLIKAIKTNDYKKFKILLKSGINPNGRTKLGELPIFYTNNIKYLRLLLKYGANPNLTKINSVETVLWKTRDIDKIKLLIKRGAIIDKRFLSSFIVKEYLYNGFDRTLWHKLYYKHHVFLKKYFCNDLTKFIMKFI